MPPQDELFLASVLDLLLDAVCAVDASGHFVFASAACESIFGYTPEEMVGRCMIDMVTPEDRQKTLEAAQQVMSGQSHLHFENRYVRKDGTLVDLMWSARWSEDKQLRVAVARDISARKRAQARQAATYAISEAAHAAQDMPALFEQIHRIIDTLLPSHVVVVALRDETGQALTYPYCVMAGFLCPELPKPALRIFCEEILRTARTGLFSHACRDQIPAHLQPLFDDEHACWLGAPLTTHEGVIGALVLQNKAPAAPYLNADKEMLQYIATQVASVIERKRLYASLQKMAQFDALTGLPNRSLFHDRLQHALARARRDQRGLTLLYLDLDHFKQINDSLGHSAGDSLLQAFAQRLQGSLRASDTAARLGGDEFVVLLESCLPPGEQKLLQQKLARICAEPFHIDGQPIWIQPSIGIAHYPEHGSDAQQLLKHADKQMYAMKKAAHLSPQPTAPAACAVPTPTAGQLKQPNDPAPGHCTE